MPAWLENAIKQRQLLRSARHRAFSIDLMKQYPGYQCAPCIHGLSKSCTDLLTNGCECFCDALTNRRFELSVKEVKKQFKKFCSFI